MVVKQKVVLFGSTEGSSGLASCPNMIDVSIYCSIVLPVLVSSETILALWVELAPVFWYRSVDFISGTFLPPKRSEGTLVERFDFDLMYLPCGSLGLFMKERKTKRKSYHLIPSLFKTKRKRKTTIGFGGTCYSRCAGSYLSS
jgi:hypothetical protein